MAERYAEFDKSRLLNFKVRIGEVGVSVILKFRNVDGTPRDISGKGWYLPVKKEPAARNNLFQLTEGDGLTVQGDDSDELKIEISASRSNPFGSYRSDVCFGSLKTTNPNRTWLNGDWEFHNGKYDGVTETDTITVSEDGDTVYITITGSSEGGGTVTLTSLGTVLQTAENDTPLEADTWNFYDSVDDILKKVSWSNIKSTLKTYFDTQYDAAGSAQSVLDVVVIPLSDRLDDHEADISNPHQTTASQIGLGNVNNTSDADKPVSTAQAAADLVAENNAKAYADSLVVNLWDDRGSFSAAGGAYPSSGGSGTAGAILRGDVWTISVAGTLPTGQVVEVGDLIRALIDTPGNTQANWAITQNNIGYVAENQANKENTTLDTSTTKYPTNRIVKEYADAKVIDSIADSDTTHAPSRNAVFDALALKSRGPAFKTNVVSSVTGTASETIIYSVLIPAGTMQANDIVDIMMSFTKVNNAGVFSTRLGFNTSSSLSGITRCIMSATTSVNQLWTSQVRSMIFKNSVSSQVVYGATSSAVSDIANAAVVKTSLSINFSIDQYLIISVEGNASDTMTLEGFYFDILR